MTAWTTTAAVRAWLKLQPAASGADEDPNLVAVVKAANQVVSRYVQAPTNGGELDPDAQLAATMLAARMERRRNSPEGVQVTADGALFVARTDPDVSRLLRIDAYAPPQVG